MAWKAVREESWLEFVLSLSATKTNESSFSARDGVSCTGMDEKKRAHRESTVGRSADWNPSSGVVAMVGVAGEWLANTTHRGYVCSHSVWGTRDLGSDRNGCTLAAYSHAFLRTLHRVDREEAGTTSISDRMVEREDQFSRWYASRASAYLWGFKSFGNHPKDDFDVSYIWATVYLAVRISRILLLADGNATLLSGICRALDGGTSWYVVQTRGEHRF